MGGSKRQIIAAAAQPSHITQLTMFDQQSVAAASYPFDTVSTGPNMTAAAPSTNHQLDPALVNALPQFGDLNSGLGHNSALGAFQSTDMMMIAALQPNGSWVRDTSQSITADSDNFAAALGMGPRGAQLLTGDSSDMWMHRPLKQPRSMSLAGGGGGATTDYNFTKQSLGATMNALPTPVSPITSLGGSRAMEFGSSGDTASASSQSNRARRKTPMRKREHLPLMQRTSAAMVNQCEQSIRRAKALEGEIQRLRETLECTFGWNFTETPVQPAIVTFQAYFQQQQQQQQPQQKQPNDPQSAPTADLRRDSTQSMASGNSDIHSTLSSAATDPHRSSQ